jgi:hypothetical protein
VNKEDGGKPNGKPNCSGEIKPCKCGSSNTKTKTFKSKPSDWTEGAGKEITVKMNYWVNSKMGDSTGPYPVIPITSLCVGPPTKKDKVSNEIHKVKVKTYTRTWFEETTTTASCGP